jgi:competence protein ComEC
MSAFTWSLLPAFRLATYVVAGILLARWFHPPQPLLIGLVIVLHLLLWFFRRSASAYNDAAMGVVAFLLCVSIGAARYGLVKDNSRVLADSLLFRDAVAVCAITEIPDVSERSTRFVGDVREVRVGREIVRPAETMRVTVTGRRDAAVAIRYGMTVLLHGQLSRPAPTRNPGEFSEKEFFEARGITLFMLVRGGNNVRVLDSVGGSWVMNALVLPLRSFMMDIIRRTSSGEEREFLSGLLLGERSGISLTTREAFTNAGVAHVLAVSGSNVVVVAAVFYFLFGMLRFPQWLVVLLSLFGLTLYMLVTGSDPPVVRATIASAIFILGSLAQLRPNPYNSLGVAAIVVLMIDPRQVFDVGFQLSFVAVLSIVYLYPIMDEALAFLRGESLWRRVLLWLARIFTSSFAATLGTLPLTAVYFSKVSVVGLFANMLVIPATGLSVILGLVTALTGVFSLWFAQVYGAVNQVLLTVALRATSFAGNLSFATVETSRFLSIYTIPFYAAVLLVFNLRDPAKSRRFILLLLAALCIVVVVPAPFIGTPGRLLVGFLDVGQGDAAVIRFPDGRYMLIDAGPRAGGFDSGARVVVPYLKRQGIDSIDILMISHPHDDHFGGAPAVYDQLAVKRTVESGQPISSSVYYRYINAVRTEATPVEIGRAGNLLPAAENIRLYLLAPDSSFIDPDTTERHANLNNTSVVAKLHYGEVSFLFSGDAEMEAEAMMVEQFGDFLKSDVLKTGHHGSRTSSSPQYLAAAAPRHAVISVGRFNSFRHPTPIVLSRLEESGVTIHRTDGDGAIFFETDGKTLHRIAWREQ